MKATPLRKLKSYLQASGYFQSVTIGEPTDPPAGAHGAVMLATNTHPSTTLNGTMERRTVMLRFYRKAFQGDVEAENTEIWMDEVVAKIQEDLFGDFDIGANIKAIYPAQMETRFGYQEIGRQAGSGGIVYRLAEIAVPMDIDDSAVYAA